MANMNIYEVVTNKMLESLKGGIIPWQKPWNGRNGFAVSYCTGKPYSLLNQFLLGGNGGEWLTFKQINTLGGHVNKGEKSSVVVFWSNVTKTEEDEDGNKVEVSFPVLKSYNVFEIGQTTGINRKHTEDITTYENTPIEDAENVVGLYFGKEVVTLHVDDNSNEAYYIPAMDEVHIPNMNQFANVEQYYATLFHEMTHSTGHCDRLNRKEVVERNMFGSEDYSKEELVAEMGSAFLCNKLGIDTEKAFNNSVAYIQSWMKALKDDPKMLVFAASKAEKAVRYILGEEVA